MSTRRRNELYLGGLIIVCTIVFVATVTLMDHFFHNDDYGCCTLPDFRYSVTTEGPSDNFTLTITFTGIDENHFTGYSDIDRLNVYVMNETDNKILNVFALEDILNGSQTNLTFFDIDDNIKLSPGDSLVIRGEWADERYEIGVGGDGEVLISIPMKVV